MKTSLVKKSEMNKMNQTEMMKHISALMCSAAQHNTAIFAALLGEMGLKDAGHSKTEKIKASRMTVRKGLKKKKIF